MIQTIFGNFKVSTIYRECSSDRGGWYYETLVFDISDKDKPKIVEHETTMSSYTIAMEQHRELVDKLFTEKTAYDHEQNQMNIIGIMKRPDSSKIIGRSIYSFQRLNQYIRQMEKYADYLESRVDDSQKSSDLQCIISESENLLQSYLACKDCDCTTDTGCKKKQERTAVCDTCSKLGHMCIECENLQWYHREQQKKQTER